MVYGQLNNMEAENRAAIQACEQRDLDLLQTAVPQFIDPNKNIGLF